MNTDQLLGAFNWITADPRYLRNLDYGKPRGGHPEGSVRAHIEELDDNFRKLNFVGPTERFSSDDQLRLLILIHVHDTFKAEAISGAAILDSRSHASLARSFLAEFVDESDLLNMVQYHDEPHALLEQAKRKGRCNPTRLSVLISTIKDWNLFLAFQIIDGCTVGKDRESLEWFFETVRPYVTSTITVADFIPIVPDDGEKDLGTCDCGQPIEQDSCPKCGSWHDIYNRR